MIIIIIIYLRYDGIPVPIETTLTGYCFRADPIIDSPLQGEPMASTPCGQPPRTSLKLIIFLFNKTDCGGRAFVARHHWLRHVIKKRLAS